MKTILITGGASGLGKGIALNALTKGNLVIAIGSSSTNGETFCNEAKQMGAADRAFFIQADLSLVSESKRLSSEVKKRFELVDAIVLCATKHSKVRTETKEGLELTFALDYLSRFILSYDLKECLDCAENPVIMNICGSGMAGDVNWNDLQHKNSFEAQKVMMHGSRLNDLSGVAFVQNDTVGKIKYILYNPWAVQTPGMMEMFGSPVMKLMYKIIGKSVDKAAAIAAERIDNLPETKLSAYRERKKMNLNHPSYNPKNARKLYAATIELLKNSPK